MRRPLLPLLCILAALGCDDPSFIGGLCAGACGGTVSGGVGGQAVPQAGAESRDAGCDAADGCADAAVDAGQCQPASYALARKRLDIYMTIDDSQTLLISWPAILDALTAFYQEDASRGLGMGLALFGAACEAPAHATPLVPIAPLPGNAAALMNAVPAIPVESTSTLPAVQGAIAYARGWARAHADTQVAALFVTDALPAECDAQGDYVTLLDQAVSDAEQGTPPIPIYVVNFGALDAAIQLATAAGTNVGMSDPSVMTVLDALHSMRTHALPCAYAVPDEASLDNDSVVHFTKADGAELRLPPLAASEACDSQADGFYIDDQVPYRVVACPRTCANLGLDSPVELQTACQTH